MNRPRHWGASLARIAPLGPSVFFLCVGCGGAEPGFENTLPQSLLASNADFVAVERADADPSGALRQALGAEPVSALDTGGYSYLAVKKSLLGRRWFLTATMKQFFPDNVSQYASQVLGTRVVSFKIQNDKFYVFDASEQFEASKVENPSILVEAYPLVRLAAFDALPGSSSYVLVDPGAGLNRFSITGTTYRDPFLSLEGSMPVRVGLSFMQNFHALPDGAAFEQVFVGDALLDGEIQSTAWGTLGISLRRYRTGPGYVAAPIPEAPFFFASDLHIVPDANRVEYYPTRWNFRPGMTPLDVFVSEGASRAQADFPDVDVLGAIRRGIESWNGAFGFTALKAVFVHDDLVRDDDKTYLLVDYPGVGVDFAFAQSHNNPNNGEILGGSVYFPGTFFDATKSFEDDQAAEAEAGAALASSRPEPGFRSMRWGGIPNSEPACVYAVPSLRELLSPTGAKLPVASSFTAKEKAALYIQHVVAHEFGHVLGLRHNFKGSLLPPSSSLMDYLHSFAGATHIATPGAYDVAAIRYLYQLSPEPPDQPFCTDEDTVIDPNCARFDAGAKPLEDFWSFLYPAVSDLVLSGEAPPEALDDWGLNAILGYARDPGVTGSVSSAERIAAIDLALYPTRAAQSPASTADPRVLAAADAASDYVLRRFALDAREKRQPIELDITDPAALEFLSGELGQIVRDASDRHSPAVRRTAADSLRALQDTSAFLELRSSRDAIQSALAAKTIPAERVPFTEDLLARIEKLLAPYFE